MRVNLLVQEADPRPLPGVNVQRSSTLAPETVPDADAIVLYANADEDEAFFNLPSSKGERMLFFQGYKALGDEKVKKRLRRGLRVVTTSKWLTEEARRLGSRPLHTPLGLDHEIFFPGIPAADRGPIVSMPSHYLDLKGTDDGIAALEIVRRQRPDAQFRLFGSVQPEFPAEFHSRLSRTEVAALLRESAVFVCPSWLEGFGLPGLEALACGAALVTTDTKGSRDYAIHEETALVSPPRKPELLAENVLRLLDDLELRRKLSRDGLEYASSHFKPWPEAAANLGRVLMEGERLLDRSS
jgi:glycosyltransferase involved in cell wall biosynthesis